MFSEWTDPYDIDNYYEDVSKILYSKTNDYIDPYSKSAQVVASQPISSSIDSAPTKIGIVQNPAPLTKSNFEVEPNTILSDGHSVWSQPPYNILMSGPPAQIKNKYTERVCSKKEFMWDPLTIILMIIIGILIIQIIKLNSIVNAHQLMFSMLYTNMRKLNE